MVERLMADSVGGGWFFRRRGVPRKVRSVFSDENSKRNGCEDFARVG